MRNPQVHRRPHAHNRPKQGNDKQMRGRGFSGPKQHAKGEDRGWAWRNAKHWGLGIGVAEAEAQKRIGNHGVENETCPDYGNWLEGEPKGKLVLNGAA